MYAGKTIFRGLFLKNSRVQIQRENQKVRQSCLHLLAQESSTDEGNRAWGLGGGAGRWGWEEKNFLPASRGELW